MRMLALRENVYGLLAPGFRRPTPAGLEAITSGDAAGVLAEGIGVLTCPLSAAGSSSLEVLLEEARSGDATVRANGLQAEYCRLFVGPYSLACPPYGSVYLDGGQVMGLSAIEAASRYRQAGLRVAGHWKEPPDHIAVELAFMARLSARYLAAVEASHEDEALCHLEAQRDFLCGHLGRWGPLFADRLVRATSCSLYRLLGEFLPAWLAFDADLLDNATAALPEEHRPCA